MYENIQACFTINWHVNSSCNKYFTKECLVPDSLHGNIAPCCSAAIVEMVDINQWRASIGCWCFRGITHHSHTRHGSADVYNGKSWCPDLTIVTVAIFLILLSGDIELNPGPIKEG